MNARATHFEQIPISEVKKIVEPEQRKERGMNEAELLYPEWQQPLLDAVLEFDPQVLAPKIEQIESLILARRQELGMQENATAEQRALDDATASLRVLKRDRIAGGK